MKKALIRFIVVSILAILLFNACQTNQKQPLHVTNNPLIVTQYAKGFRITEINGLKILDILSPWDSTSLLSRLVLWPDSVSVPDSLQMKKLLKIPIKNLIALSSTQWAMAVKLESIGVISGVSEASYIRNPQINSKINDGIILEVASNGAYKPELILQQNPDLILYSPDPSGVPDVLKRLGKVVLPWPDYFEIEPLGRTEWIRLMGILLGKSERADSIFKQADSNYNLLKNKTLHLKNRPTIFADKEFSGQWYVPGGKSYMARLFADAGANYLWSDNRSTASFALGIEQIIEKAHSADYWRIAQSATKDYSFEDLRNENELYATFKAFNDRKIIFCNTSLTSYFEESQLEPQIVLADFIKLMHPELLPEYSPKYYQFLQ